MNKSLYFAWVPFQRRQVSMESYFNYSCVFLPLKWRANKLAKLASYAVNMFMMIVLLFKEKPIQVWIQVPQTFLIWPCVIYKIISKVLFRKRVLIIADCHNAMFRTPWCKVPLGISLLKKCDVSIVHNSSQIQAAEKLGVDTSSMYVLEDAPANFDFCTEEVDVVNVPKPWVLFPASFAKDEPIKELVEVAKILPDYSFFITGNKQRAKGILNLNSLPENVNLMGFMDIDKFDWLLLNSDLILALTIFDGIQLSVCNEAVGATKPMVASNTSILMELFPKGTVFVDPLSVKSMAEGIVTALVEVDRLSDEMGEFKGVRYTYWESQAKQVSAKLN